MSITYQNSIDSIAAKTTSFDVGSGDNRFLLVGTLNNEGGNASAVTYNGTSMTLIDTIAAGYVGHQKRLWGLIAPSTGSNDIVVTSNNGVVGITAVCYNGVDQISGYGASNTGVNSSSAAASVSVTTTNDGAWVSGYISAINNWTADSNTTKRGSRNICFGDSGNYISPAGSYAIGHSSASMSDIIVCEIIPDEFTLPFTPKVMMF